MNKTISIVKTVADVERDLYYIVLNTSDIRVEIFDENTVYPEGTFFVTMPKPDENENRYAVIPTRLH